MKANNKSSVQRGLPYQGNKARIVPFLMEHLPYRPGIRFLDASCGGGTVGLSYGRNHPDTVVTLNDINRPTTDLLRQRRLRPLLLRGNTAKQRS